MKINDDKYKSLIRISLYGISILLWIAIWHFYALYIDKEIFLPTPKRVFDVLIHELLPSESFRLSVVSSLKNIGYGFLIGLIFGLVLAIFAAWVNSMIPGANYLYMARPESAPSILDILPPNYALRISIIIIAITFMFILAYLPWYIKDKKLKP